MPYLAMTAAEFRSCKELPDKPAWMACHFSPYGTGLTNLPLSLPAHSLLILNDRTPVHGHDPMRIFDQLAKALDALKCEAILLDLQQNSEETHRIIEKLLQLPCPVIVSEKYAGSWDCPVFLSPVPLLKTVKEHIAPWQGRQIWLEAALDGAVITVTENGSTHFPLHPADSPECSLEDHALHCHYSIEVSAAKAVFTLRRTMEDLKMLLAESKELGVTQAVGLYQELT